MKHLLTIIMVCFGYSAIAQAYMLIKDSTGKERYILMGAKAPISKADSAKMAAPVKFAPFAEYNDGREMHKDGWRVMIAGAFISFGGAATLLGATLFKSNAATTKQFEKDASTVRSLKIVGYSALGLGIGLTIPASFLHIKAAEKSKLLEP